MSTDFRNGGHDYIEVPNGALEDETVDQLIEEFVLRDGTDYGAVEASLERKIKDVRQQMDRGLVKVVFDTDTQSATLILTNELAKLRR